MSPIVQILVAGGLGIAALLIVWEVASNWNVGGRIKGKNAGGDAGPVDDLSLGGDWGGGGGDGGG